MTWLVWRQYRASGAIAVALLAAAAAAILTDGFQIAAHWHSILVTCAGNSTCLEQQGPLVNGVVSDFPYLSLIVPVVLGMLWGNLSGCIAFQTVYRRQCSAIAPKTVHPGAQILAVSSLAN